MNGEWLRIYTIVFLHLTAITVNGQDLQLIDEIAGNFGRIQDLTINKDGERFYIIDKVFDSIAINGMTTILPPRDSIPGSSYYFGRSYFIGVKDQSYFLFRPGGSALVLKDSSIIVFNTIIEDTLITNDTIFVNSSLGNSGGNLLMTEYDFFGNVMNVKQWSTECHCYMFVNRAIFKDNDIYICGEYSSLEPINLDGNVLAQGYHNSFFAQLNDHFEFNRITEIDGPKDEYFSLMANNIEDKFLATGTSTSYKISFCEDSLINPSDFIFNSEFIYFILFDTAGLCHEYKTPDFDVGGLIPTSIINLKDNSFAVSGTYNSSFIHLDKVNLLNPNHDQVGFIIKFAENLSAINSFQLEGSVGSKYILSINEDLEGNIWMTGVVYSDTLKVGSHFIYLKNDEEYFGFLAKLDKELKPISVLRLEGVGERLIKGFDGSMYVLEHLLSKGDQTRLYKINQLSEIGIIMNRDLTLNLYPNPANTNDEITFVVKSPKNEKITNVNVYSAIGEKIWSDQINEESGILHIPGAGGIYFAEFYTSLNRKAIKKVLVY